MAICNILGDMQNSTGTFLTFSQYIDDLTRWQTDSHNHKIKPSKFVALNIKPLKRIIIKNFNINLNNSYNYNSWVPSIFTNFIENRCAWLKTNDVNGKWTPNHFKNVFWEVMFEQQENVETVSPISEENIQIENQIQGSLVTPDDIMYVGNINIQSYDNINGQSYSEIYCYIPNEAKRGSYNLNTVDVSQSQLIGIDNEQISISSKLIGYEHIGDATEYITRFNMVYSEPKKNYHIESNNLDYNDDKFDINAIVVLYDIGDTYTDIPMGIYFPGIIDNDGVIQNPITKFVSNKEIYGSGTSYGLRICNRYATTTNTHEIDIHSNDYASLSLALSKISQTCDKMNEFVNKFNSNNDVNKSLIDLFKNTQVNVPYIKSVNGVDYWFVNGKKLTKVYK